MGCDDWESTLVQLINNNSTPLHSSSARHSNPANTIISDSGEPTQFPLHPSNSLALSSFAPSAAQTCIFTVDYNPNFLVLGWWWWWYFFLPSSFPSNLSSYHPSSPPHIISLLPPSTCQTFESLNFSQPITANIIPQLGQATSLSVSFLAPLNDTTTHIITFYDLPFLLFHTIIIPCSPRVCLVVLRWGNVRNQIMLGNVL